MMQNYEDKSRKITQNWYDNYTFSETKQQNDSSTQPAFSL